MQGYLEATIFSKDYRRMIADLKKLVRQDLREEAKLDDIRTGQGAGRKGSADMSASISQGGYTRRSTRKKSGSTDREADSDSNAGAVASNDGQV